MATKESLLESLKKTIISDGKGLSTETVVEALRQIVAELTTIAMDKTDAGLAIENYVIDIHGVVREKK